MQRMILPVIILIVGITSGAWMPLKVALPVSIITGWIAGIMFAQGIER